MQIGLLRLHVHLTRSSPPDQESHGNWKVHPDWPALFASRPLRTILQERSCLCLSPPGCPDTRQPLGSWGQSGKTSGLSLRCILCLSKGRSFSCLHCGWSPASPVAAGEDSSAKTKSLHACSVATALRKFLGTLQHLGVRIFTQTRIPSEPFMKAKVSESQKKERPFVLSDGQGASEHWQRGVGRGCAPTLDVRLRSVAPFLSLLWCPLSAWGPPSKKRAGAPEPWAAKVGVCSGSRSGPSARLTGAGGKEA